MTCYVTRRGLGTKVEVQKPRKTGPRYFSKWRIGRKSKVWATNSFVSRIIGSDNYVFFLDLRFCVRIFKYGGRFWPI